MQLLTFDSVGAFAVLLLCLCAVTLCLFAPLVSAGGRVLSLSAATQGAKVELAFSDAASATTKADSDVAKTLSYPGEMPGDLSFDGSKHMRLKLTTPKEYTPKSAFVQFVSKQTGQSALFLLKSDGGQVYTLKQSLGSSELIESLSGSGAYDIIVVYGDAGVERAVEWKVATIDLTLAPSGKADYAAQFALRPEIHHLFRTPDPRPMKIIPLFFTLAVLAPFAGLLIALSQSGVKFALPTNPSEFLYATVFQASILAILLSFALYWLSLNIFQALALSAVCGGVAVFSGTGALRLLHQRTSARKEGAKEE